MSTLDAYPLVLAAECLWREARNQPYSAMLGAACVMRNSLTPEHDLVAEVTRRLRYSSMTAPGDPNLVKWPESSDTVFPMCCQAVDAVFGPSPIEDVTVGARNYFSPPVTEPPADWGPVVFTVKLGDLSFYKPA